MSLYGCVCDVFDPLPFNYFERYLSVPPTPPTSSIFLLLCLLYISDSICTHDETYCLPYVG